MSYLTLVCINGTGAWIQSVTRGVVQTVKQTGGSPSDVTLEPRALKKQPCHFLEPVETKLTQNNFPGTFCNLKLQEMVEIIEACFCLLGIIYKSI